MIHFKPIPSKPRRRCDTRALAEARERIRRELENDAAERRISRDQSEGHMPRHFKAHRIFQLTGEINGTV